MIIRINNSFLRWKFWLLLLSCLVHFFENALLATFSQYAVIMLLFNNLHYSVGFCSDSCHASEKTVWIKILKWIGLENILRPQTDLPQWPKLNTPPVRSVGSKSMSGMRKSIHTQLQTSLQTADIFNARFTVACEWQTFLFIIQFKLYHFMPQNEFRPS